MQSLFPKWKQAFFFSEFTFFVCFVNLVSKVPEKFPNKPWDFSYFTNFQKEVSDMGTVENKQLLQNIFSEISHGDARPFIEGLADDVQWTLIGSTNWSRTFEGKHAILTELLMPLGAKLANPIQLTAYRFIAEDDFVVVQARGTNNTTKDGKPYNNTYCFVFRLADGKIQEVTEYADTELVTSALG